MKTFYDNVPDVTVVTQEKDYQFIIKSTQYLNEDDDRVYLKCVEHVPMFKRGLVCDLIIHYATTDLNEENREEHSDLIRDVVLVYINKEWDLEGMPQFEYVSYK